MTIFVVLFCLLAFLLFLVFINFRFNARQCVLKSTVETETNLISTKKEHVPSSVKILV